MAQSTTDASFNVATKVAAAQDLTLVSPNGRLISVDVYITSRCNRSCTYCFLPAEFFASGALMSMESFAGVVRWSKGQGVGEITLLGGEPSLHPSFATMVGHASDQGLSVRVVTNGARRFQRLLSDGVIGTHNLSRVAVSLDTLDEGIQDTFRGPRSWQDAMAALRLLRERAVPFDINVTGIKPALGRLDELIDFAEREGCRRVNIHWPSTMGMGSTLSPDLIPARPEWDALVRRIAGRVARRPGFFAEIERGFLSGDARLTGCALDEFSNLQVFPDGRAYRCGLLVDHTDMASLSMVGDQLTLIHPHTGEELLRSSLSSSCAGCPVIQSDSRRACIYDKVHSAPAT